MDAGHETPREVNAHIQHPPCPHCGEYADETAWIVNGRFYCSELCARTAADKIWGAS